MSSSFPRAAKSAGSMFAGASRQQQLAVLAAFGSVSVVAIYIWYQKRQEHARKMAARTASQNGNASSSKLLNGAAETEKQEREEEETTVLEQQVRSEEREETADMVTVQKTSSLIASATTAAVQGSGDNADNDEHKHNDEICSSSDISDTDSSSHSAKSSGDVDGDFDVEEPATLEAASTLQLEVCESFSWAEDVERSYSEAMANEQRSKEEEAAAVAAARLEAAGYEGAESPGVISQGSEDSGRATGGLASSLSPLDDAASANTTPNGTLIDSLPMYEFEIPNSLVGLIIGIKGKTIKELSTRTDVKMLIRSHHTPEKVDSHQICQVRGKRDDINRCLQMLRRRFPPARFPELNLQPVLPPALPTNMFDVINAQPTWLTLPEGVSCEAAVVNCLDCGHLFVQQPTHPTFSSLSVLDHYMIRLYSQPGGVPDLQDSIETGVLCAAPVMNAWFRAVTVLYFADEDEMLVRFVDYGGYMRIARAELRQIRTDLMSLPFQATECYLAHVQPVDGTSQWSPEATELFRSHAMNKVVDITVVGYHVDDRVPMVEVTFNDENGKLVRIDRILMEEGYAKAADPSKIHRITPPAGKRRGSRQLSVAASGDFSAAV